MAEQIGYWIGVLLGGFVAGAICGILPLIIALKKDRRAIGLVSWISCVVAGLILGLILAVPVALVFTVVAICLKRPVLPGQVELDGQSTEPSAGQRGC